MDILRVLSLGTTRKPSRAGASGSSAATLPSAGSRPNAQFFHDDVGGASHGIKRKRPDEVEDEPEDELSDLDFFAPKDEVKGASSKKADKAKTNHTQKPKSKPNRPKAQLLDEDECKQILRSHRLKFTLLSDGADRKAKVKKSKKKAKAVEEVKSTNKAKQLFPQPLRAFSELRSQHNVSTRLAENVEAQGYKEPTEVQMGSLPLMLDPAMALAHSSEDTISTGNVDFMAVAPTGSGKTISFLIPAINGVMKRRAGSKDRKHHSLEVIVLAPTRELANQILNEARKLTVGTGLKVVTMKKGMRLVTGEAQSTPSKSKEERTSKDSDDGDSASSESESESTSDDNEEDGDESAKPITKADILITTPMPLLNFLSKGKLSWSLPSVQSLILDEADVLLDQLFREQTTGIWSACTHSDLQLNFWSATMGSNIETIITDQLKAHATKRDIQPNPLIRLVVGLKDTAVPNITHKLIYTATEPGKLLAVRQLLHPASGADSGPPLRPPFLIFTQTIDRATALHDELKYDIPMEAGGSSRIAVLHSSLAESLRADIMRRFRLGEVWVLITTDVLARGVDFAGVNGVVNYDVPSSAAVYVHRAGRTGRAGREGGVAVTFYTKEDIPFVKSVANVIAMSEKQAGKTGEAADVQKWLLDALPNVKKEDKKKMKTQGGVAGRKTAKITSKSAWERRKENNKRDAIQMSKKRKAREADEGKGDESDWGGLDD
ncbi:P-loop containing nucleoside triphosphate hydrolase protein [Coniella lustricola]|uniref:ATP-dependent RNA helicase ROK1 n=1 Tax=Coniella lustricola TaxID=2025994 RepID=A0A2T3A5U1_9PEZI|nr:P-loop containing nucleoside triphosphate hydrolase protein [Coniella lustricola]